MKVLYVQDLFPPETFGGGEIYSENIITALKKRGVKFEVVAGTKGRTRTTKYKGVTVHRVNFTPSRYFFNIRAIKKMEEVVQRFKPDIIHGNAMQAAIPASLIGDKYKIPSVINVHFYFQKYYREYYDPIRAGIFSKIEKYVMKHSYDKIISLDKYVYDNLKNNKINSILIEHPIDINRFKFRKKPNKFTVGTMMTMGPSKRNDLFIDFAKNHSSEYDFIACGNYNKEFKKKLLSAGIKSYGYIPHGKIHNFYNKMHVYFGHGMAAKEAMASGCVAILNENTERLRKYHIKELKHGAMLNGNHDVLINQLYSDKNFLMKHSVLSSAFIKKNYSNEIIIPKILNVYKELMK